MRRISITIRLPTPSKYYLATLATIKTDVAVIATLIRGNNKLRFYIFHRKPPYKIPYHKKN